MWRHAAPEVTKLLEGFCCLGKTLMRMRMLILTISSYCILIAKFSVSLSGTTVIISAYDLSQAISVSTLACTYKSHG
ncbi:hypothetical protein DsansV1_C18g0153151 [Dioscorea sansibarensis]